MRVALPSKPQPARSEQIILFRVSGQLFAISSASVQEVRSVDSVTSSGKDVSHPQIPKVKHFVQRGEASLYVVDAAMHFGLALAAPALVFVLRRNRTALLIDGIERMSSMTRLQALPQSFCHEEREWYRGLSALDQIVVPVVKPEGFLTVDELFSLDALMLQSGANLAASRTEAVSSVPPSGSEGDSDSGSDAIATFDPDASAGDAGLSQ